MDSVSSITQSGIIWNSYFALFCFQEEEIAGYKLCLLSNFSLFNYDEQSSSDDGFSILTNGRKLLSEFLA